MLCNMYTIPFVIQHVWTHMKAVWVSRWETDIDIAHSCRAHDRVDEFAISALQE